MAKNPIFMLLEELFEKKRITEVAINGPNLIFVEKDNRFFQLDSKISAEQITHFAQEIALFNKRQLDEKHPILDGKLPSGQRVNIISPPYVGPTAVITIRNMTDKGGSFDDHPQIFGLSTPWVHFLKALVQTKANIIVSGGTGTGKTTLLNLLLHEIPRHERVVTIEETRELQIEVPNVIYMEASNSLTLDEKGLTMRDLVRNTLRMRPDRIIVGEVRGSELFDLLQSMNTGHEGCMASIHANSAIESFARMSTLYLLSGFDVPAMTIKRQIAGAIHFVIQISRGQNGERYINEILEITGVEGENILSQKIGIAQSNKLKFTGIAPKMSDRLKKAGLIPDNFFENLS